jgi:hypothetical protein
VVSRKGTISGAQRRLDAPREKRRRSYQEGFSGIAIDAQSGISFHHEKLSHNQEVSRKFLPKFVSENPKGIHIRLLSILEGWSGG